jgi:hypothetical protein
MTCEHPAPSLIEEYLINHLSEADTARIEKHVFACNSCFSRVASSDLESLALRKACLMLAKLESDGTRVLTMPIPEPTPKPALIPFDLWQFQFKFQFRLQHATVLATVALAAAATFSSVRSINNTPATTVALVRVPPPVQFGMVAPAPIDRDEHTDGLSHQRRVRAQNHEPVYIMNARFVRPFLPPNGDVEAPELDMNHVPPPLVVARGAEVPAAILQLPDVPKKQVSGSRRVLRAIASPFKKIGLALAVVAVGRADLSPRSSAGI